MRILGISGIEGTIEFKRRHWPGRSEAEYRISQGHDAAAALAIDGEIVAAAAEERFTRRKHTGDFPTNAIAYCLNEAGLTAADVDEVVHSFDYGPMRVPYSLDPCTKKLYDSLLSPSVFDGRVRRNFPDIEAHRIHHLDHHLAHAASAAMTSGWSECAVLVVDGMGESQGISIYRYANEQLRLLRQISASHSIGIFYSLITLHLGFDFNSDEYKIMGLAPYGDPVRHQDFFRDAVQLHDGTVSIPMLSINQTREEREFYLKTREYLAQHLIPPRNPHDEVDDSHRDVAASLQACLDETMLGLGLVAKKLTGLRNLAMAGGVALNCTANGKLIASHEFDAIYVQPAAGDDGTALGAALYRSAAAKSLRNRRSPVPFFGPQSEEADIEAAITAFLSQIRTTRYSSLELACAEAARRIADGQVLAWFQGRMEFGPRALGNRSIIADPAHPEMRDRINAMVKKREGFRPFAPAVSARQVGQWFDVAPGSEFPYMIFIVDVRNEHRALLPAITHVNGSARVQTVSEHDNPAFFKLLEAVGHTTGREMVLNTSFNVKGQPIVNTASEAVETFLGTGIDALFLHSTLVERASS